MVNYNQRLLDRLNDPATPRAEYMRLWNEWQGIVYRQKVLDEQAAKRRREGPTNPQPEHPNA